MFLRKILTNADGALDTDDFLKLLNKKDLPQFITVMGGKMDDALKEMFPKVTELAARRNELLKLAKAGDEAAAEAARSIKLNPVLEAAAKVHEFAQETLGVRKINKFFSRVYLSVLNPGTLLRNLYGDTVVSALDEGLTVFGKSAKSVTEEVALWRGGEIPTAMHRAFGGAATILNAEGKADKVATLSYAAVERGGSARLFGKVYLEKMEGAVKFGFALGDPETLHVAGASEGMLKRLEQLVIQNHGNVDDALITLRTEYAVSGGAEVWRNPELWMQPWDIANAKSAQIWDKIQDALKANGDEVYKALDNIYAQRFKVAAGVYDEAAGTLDEFKDVVEFIPKAKRDQFEARVMADQIAEDGLFKAYDDLLYAVNNTPNGQANRPALDTIRQTWTNNATPLRNSARLERVDVRKKVLEWYQEKDYKKIWTQITADPIWKKSGLTTDIPQSKKAFNDLLWNELYPTVNETNFRNALDGMRGIFTTLTDQLLQIAGGQLDETTIGTIFGQVLQKVAHADEIGWASISKKGITLDMFQAAVRRGDNASAIRILAKKYGFSTARGTEAAGLAGTMDKNLIKAINEHLGTEFKTLAEVSIDDARKALDAWATAKGKPIPEIIEATKKIAPPYDGETMFTPARAAYESLPGLRDFIARTSDNVRRVMGQVETGSFTPELEKALFQWQKESKARIARADMHAVAAASHARDFALHGYGDRDVFDLAYSYLMPYGFWYRKTYEKMLRRFAENPEILAAYVKYRHAMERENANLPDWWKYNIKIDNVLGYELENPLFFNLEATLNPLNGITGVDFDDPYKRVNWWTSALDDMADFGPSLWTPLNLAIAYALKIKGEQEAASHWGSRLFPQTQVVKSLTNIAGVKAGGVELDPAVWLFSDGIDPYECNRIGRALGMLVNEGADEAEATESARTYSGPLWEAAKTRAMDQRQWGSLGSYILGIGFRSRSESDLSIDQFYNDYSAIWNNEPNLSSEEFKAAFDRLRKDYPFMDVLLLARKGSIERDRSYSYSVLSRIPPSQLDDVADAVSLDRRLIDKFYDEKGGIDKWTESDRLAFMSAMIGIGAALDIPPQATRTEWSAASSAYRTMADAGENLFGKSIWDEVDLFYQQDNRDIWLQSHPQVQAALDWKAQYVLASPLLSAYYGGEEIFYRYYHGQMMKDMNNQLGEGIFVEMQTYWDLTRYGNQEDVNAYKRLHPNISKYYDIRDEWQVKIDLSINKLLKTLPEGEGIVLRKEKQQSIAGQDLLAAQQPPLTWNDWKGLLSSSAEDALLAYFKNGAPIPYFTEQQLEKIAEDRGTSYGQLLSIIGQTIP
jgi:hypothetical protein